MRTFALLHLFFVYFVVSLFTLNEPAHAAVVCANSSITPGLLIETNGNCTSSYVPSFNGVRILKYSNIPDAGMGFKPIEVAGFENGQHQSYKLNCSGSGCVRTLANYFYCNGNCNVTYTWKGNTLTFVANTFALSNVKVTGPDFPNSSPMVTIADQSVQVGQTKRLYDEISAVDADLMLLPMRLRIIQALIISLSMERWLMLAQAMF